MIENSYSLVETISKNTMNNNTINNITITKFEEGHELHNGFSVDPSTSATHDDIDNIIPVCIVLGIFVLLIITFIVIVMMNKHNYRSHDEKQLQLVHRMQSTDIDIDINTLCKNVNNTSTDASNNSRTRSTRKELKDDSCKPSSIIYTVLPQFDIESDSEDVLFQCDYDC
eukprot:Awhi_evm1s10614